MGGYQVEQREKTRKELETGSGAQQGNIVRMANSGASQGNIMRMANSDLQQGIPLSGMNTVGGAAPRTAKGGGPWVHGVSPSVRMIAEMEADLRRSKTEKEKIAQEEKERFIKGHKRITPVEPMNVARETRGEIGYGRAVTPNVLHQSDKEKDKVRYEGDDPYITYSKNRFYTIMNTMQRMNRWPTAEELGGKPMTPGELKAAMRAQKAITEDMKNGEHSRLEENRVLYRGVGANYTGILQNLLGVEKGASEEKLRKKMQGSTITDKALMSTSLDPNIAADFARQHSQGPQDVGTTFQLYVPKGTKAQYIAPTSQYQYEQEMLLDNNAPIRIIDVNSGWDGMNKEYRMIRGAVTHGNLLGGHRNKK